MRYRIVVSFEAQEHLKSLSAREQRAVLARIDSVLAHEPFRITRHVKLLRPNPLARYELRARDLRVFYDSGSSAAVVNVVAIGRKTGNTLTIGGLKVTL